MLTLNNLEVYEIMLGADFLMSSLFTVVEVALSDLGLAAALKAFPGHQKLDVVVGGLGLGYTARAALAFPELASLSVVDYLQPVIDWHKKGLVPLGPGLTADARCQFVHGDFFKCATADADAASFVPDAPGKKFHAVLLDIDHSPDHLLNAEHAAFYQPEGLRKLANKLHPGGIFALWSDDPPEETFMRSLNDVFDQCETHVVPFDNPILERQSESTVYVCQVPY